MMKEHTGASYIAVMTVGAKQKKSGLFLHFAFRKATSKGRSVYFVLSSCHGFICLSYVEKICVYLF